MCDWLAFRKVLDFFRGKKVTARPLGELKIGLPSADKMQTDVDEEQGISISGTSEGSFELGEIEKRQQKVGEKLELLVDNSDSDFTYILTYNILLLNY